MPTAVQGLDHSGARLPSYSLNRISGPSQTSNGLVRPALLGIGQVQASTDYLLTERGRTEHNLRGTCLMRAAPVPPLVPAGAIGRRGMSERAHRANYCRTTAVIHKPCHIALASRFRSEFKIWSGARDLNPGPHGPEPCRCGVLWCPTDSRVVLA